MKAHRLRPYCRNSPAKLVNPAPIRTATRRARRRDDTGWRGVSGVSGDYDRVASAVAAFQRAAIDDIFWLPALDAMAQATGANHGQMIGLGAAAAVPFNWVSNVASDALQEFVAIGGGDPRNNPRVKAGLAAGEMEVLAEADFATPEELARTPIYADLFTRHDMPFSLLTRLATTHDVAIGFSTLRSRKQGHASDEQRTMFAAIASHARTAVSMRLALQHRGATLMAGALEAVSAAAFVLDGMGCVAAMTPAAEALLAGPVPRLRLVGGRLMGRTGQEDAVVAPFIARTMASRLEAPPLLATLRNGLDPLVLEAMPVPDMQHGFGFGLRAIIVARAGAPRPRAHAAMQAAFGLTAAEVSIVLMMTEGRSPEEIARERGVSIETVRSQIRALMTKTETRRQSELVALVARYL
jgi:DNA-binding CsgD family transcriptional regulator